MLSLSAYSGSDDDEGGGDGIEMCVAGVCNTSPIASYVRCISVSHLPGHMSRATGHE